MSVHPPLHTHRHTTKPPLPEEGFTVHHWVYERIERDGWTDKVYSRLRGSGGSDGGSDVEIKE